jgi:hypothetical protein
MSDINVNNYSAQTYVGTSYKLPDGTIWNVSPSLSQDKYKAVYGGQYRTPPTIPVMRCRLRVVADRLFLDDTEVDLSDLTKTQKEPLLKVIDGLIKNGGNLAKPTDFLEDGEFRFSTKKKKLPKKILNLIEGLPGRGTRLRPEAFK